MAYGVVSAGTVSTAAGNVTPAFGATTTAGNLLICFASVSGSSTASVTTATGGWTKSVGSGTSGSPVTAAGIFHKIAAGSDGAPTITAASAPISLCAAVLVEFSGNAAASPLDRFAGPNPTATSPVVATCAAADEAAGELICSASMWTLTMSGTNTITDSFNNGGTSNDVGNNDSSSTTTHYKFSYAITTGNASADQNSQSSSNMNISQIAICIASFKLPTIFQPRNAAVNHQNPGVLMERQEWERKRNMWRPRRPKLWKPDLWLPGPAAA